MLENRSATAEPPLTCRARSTNDPLRGRVSRNTSRGRRIADIYRAILRAVDHPDDPLVQADVLRAAELRVASEDARQRVLAGGDGININIIDQIVRLEGLADRAVRRLGLDARKREQKPGAALAAHLARTAAAPESPA